MKKDFLLELLLEEMPATQIKDIELQLKKNFEDLLKEKEIEYKEIIPFSTSKRIGVYINEMEEFQREREEEIIGPPYNISFQEEKPTQALLSFLKKEGMEEKIDKVYKVSKGKGEYIAIKKLMPVKATEEILKENLSSIILNLKFIKPMCWGERLGPFIRPLHSILSLFGEKIVEFEIFKIKPSNLTNICKDWEKISLSFQNPFDYLNNIKNYIEIFYEKRKEKIISQVENLIKDLELNYKEEDPIISEWAYLSENPTIVLGKFKDDYLSLPKEILIQVLKKHQKALPLFDKNNKITKNFLALVDKPEIKNGEIIKGIEWVVEARLKDGAFFFNQDLKVPLIKRVEDLKNLSFHPDLGNYLQKTGRLLELSEFLAYNLDKKDLLSKILTASKISKADLMTSTVIEFPSLQGKIGGILSKREGYPEEISLAIYEQYYPETLEGKLPSNDLSVILNLSDKVETIVSLISVGEIPTGSQDPYGLRRLGNGLIEILVEKKLDCDLDLIFTKGFQLLNSPKFQLNEILEILRNFVKERISYIFERKNISSDTIKAVLEVRHFNPYDAFQRAKAIEEYRKEKEFINFILSYKRLKNIIKDYNYFEIKPELFKEKEEPKLFEDFLQIKEEFLQNYNHKNYLSALKVMTCLAPSLEEFFEKVFILTEEMDLRKNRIALLQGIYKEFLKIAQFSHLLLEKSYYKENG